MGLPATRFRATLYQVLDQVLSTGVAIEVELRGRRVRISPAEPKSKLDRLIPRPDAIVGDPEALVKPTFGAKAWERATAASFRALA
jgi:hypothetical protein